MDFTKTLSLTVELVGNYYAGTLCLWLGHWFSHQPWSPFRNHHLLSHHYVYPDSLHCRSRRFLMFAGKYDSNKALFPWFLLAALLECILLPGWLAACGVLELVLVAAWFAWVHLQFHLEQAPLDRWNWFQHARARHLIHHDCDKNFGVSDHFWDRLFGTFTEDRLG
jgi:sterol desaturase/sphingolipid hydroxylase (fatty acid hydroxylase superfamily)